MSQYSEEAQDEIAHVLTASVRDIRYFAALFRGISFAKVASVTVSSTGLIVTAEEARTLLGTAYVFSEIFDEYNYTPDPQQAAPSQDSQDDSPLNAAFDINLTTLLDCINILGTAGPSSTKPNDKARKYHRIGDEAERDGEGAGPSRRNGRAKNGAGGDVESTNKIDQYFAGQKGTGMRLSYAGAGYPLTLLIAEDAGGPTATCQVTTFDAEPRLELPFDSDLTVLKIILKSSWLRDALSEIDPSCEKFTIIGNPPPPPGRAPRTAAPPRFRIKAVGNYGSTEMDYPNDKEVLETCDCPAEVNFSYKFSHIQKAQRALQNSTKTSLRIDEDGLLSLQFLMPSPKPRHGNPADAFIEFRCLPLEEDSK